MLQDAKSWSKRSLTQDAGQQAGIHEDHLRKQDRDGSSELWRYTLHTMGVADLCVENKPLCSCATVQFRPIVFCHSTMGHILDLPSSGATQRLRRMFLFGPLMFLTFFTTGECIHMDSVGSHSMFTCESIGLRMCQDLPYNTTFMPNLLNHYDQQTAALAMEVREPLFLYCPDQVGKMKRGCHGACCRGRLWLLVGWAWIIQTADGWWWLKYAWNKYWLLIINMHYFEYLCTWRCMGGVLKRTAVISWTFLNFLMKS